MSDTALVHYWLTNMRGGENVLAELCGLFPDADIFTHACARSKMPGKILSHKITETFIGRLPGAHSGCQKYLPLMPLALKRLDLSGYRLIISSESGPAKGFRKPAGAFHVCYCHTPMRYLWDMYDDYYRAAGFAGKLAMRIFRDPLRRYDLASADSVDRFIANSEFVAERIRRIYGRDSTVIHPPVDTSFFQAAREPKEDYYLFAGQLIGYKRPDLAAAACRRMNRKLVFVGDGPMRRMLERPGDPLIRFTGRVEHEGLRKLYAGAKALIFPGIEDFGIVPLEAQAAGTPVIALGKGGALETVVPEKTGIFFPEPAVESLCGAIEQFESMKFEDSVLRKNPERFSCAVFDHKFMDFIREVCPI